jgi:hypothetical protein
MCECADAPSEIHTLDERVFKVADSPASGHLAVHRVVQLLPHASDDARHL